MRTDDVEAVLAVAGETLWHDGPSEGWWRRARAEHLLATDPDGAWVATDGGDVVGVAMALVRERLWGLSLLAVSEHALGHGAGRGLVDHAVGTLDRAGTGIILSSENPAAMRIYATSGFALRPCVALAGDVRFRPERPAAVGEATAADHGWMDDVARAVRGGPYSGELPLWQARDAQLLCVAERGWL
ncbi:MAG: hypothetical protein QOG68_2072, partial [Solirubrobacteraceae bacterium]|nr:hypothetical protein [Solirubrobacteraceae bacterium]